MPRLSREALAACEPRWPRNRHGIEAPDGICGDYKCACADEARQIMTEAEYQLAFGVPKEFGLSENDKAAWFAGTYAGVTEGF